MRKTWNDCMGSSESYIYIKQIKDFSIGSLNDRAWLKLKVADYEAIWWSRRVRKAILFWISSEMMKKTEKSVHTYFYPASVGRIGSYLHLNKWYLIINSNQMELFILSDFVCFSALFFNAEWIWWNDYFVYLLSIIWNSRWFLRYFWS